MTDWKVDFLKRKELPTIGYVVFYKPTSYYGLARRVVGKTKTHYQLGWWAGSLPDENGGGIYIRPIWNVKKNRVRFRNVPQGFVSDEPLTASDIRRAARILRRWTGSRIS